ncbi:MAG: TadE/TadG family type IV pilus assembly protein [Dehalococcoidia bacterium]
MKTGDSTHREYLPAHRERGQALVIVAMLLVPIMGLVALAIDVGNLAVTRRRLQNAVDAAALAGISQLPSDRTEARQLADDKLVQNGLIFGDVSSVVISTTDFTDDTIEVYMRRRVPYIFGRALGFTNSDVTATATAKLYVIQGIDTERAGMFPYAVWGGNKHGPSDIKAGKSVIYRSNQYAQKNVGPIPGCHNPPLDNCNWNIQGNNFKGYFHWKNRYVYIDPTTTDVFDQGGNAFGTDAADELDRAQKSGTPVWLPIITYADDDGTTLNFRVVNFACVLLDPIDFSGSSDWTGTVLDPDNDGRCARGGGLRNGGQPPPNNLMPLYSFSLTQ